MTWNWELPGWPNFSYRAESLQALERQFLIGCGSAAAYLKSIDDQEYSRFIVEILSAEGLESARIEGEILDRESLQSSIQKHFGMQKEYPTGQRESEREAGMAALLCDVYKTFDSQERPASSTPANIEATPSRCRSFPIVMGSLESILKHHHLVRSLRR
jgi:hypothetical protein